MPIVNIKLNIENDLKDGALKHFLNDVDFDVYSAKKDDSLFSMVAKKPEKESATA